MSTFTFPALGTQWEIETPAPLSEELRQRILESTEQFDATYSRFRPDSLVTQVAQAPDGGRFEFPEEASALFDLYDRLHEATGGAMDPLVGRDLELLGYDREYTLTPVAEEVRMEARARGRVCWSQDVLREDQMIVTQRPVVIDVGAVGKGYLVDLLCQWLHQAGVHEFVVDGSGDLRHSGPSTLPVGLEHPFDPGLVIGVAQLQNGALCASASNRRAWGDGLHHVLDARTGLPVHDVVATWVMAENAATADGLATALFFMEAAELTPSFSFAAVRMFKNGRAEHTLNFQGELFT
jgi:thiamine biosynthesis lipoprotein